MLKGRCRNCGLRISARYPFVELANGLLFVLVYVLEVPAGYGAELEESCLYSHIGPQIVDGWSPVFHVNLRYLYHMVLIESLLVASLIDWDLKIIPDGSTVPAMIVGFLTAAAVGHVHLVPVWFQDPGDAAMLARLLPESFYWIRNDHYVPQWIAAWPHLHGLAVSVAGFLAGGGIIWGVRLLGFWILRREAMGFGDVILMAMIGSFLGWQAVVIVFFLAPLIALLVVVVGFFLRREREIPYGPYLSLAAVIVLLRFHDIWPFWERIFATGVFVPVMAVVGTCLMAFLFYFMQVVKRVLGIPLYEERVWYEEVWTSADQLEYQYSENHDRQQGRWRVNCREWPGIDAGQGTLQANRWRHPPCPDHNSIQHRLE
jgi:leader peptidase (prepilin peptidase)/N-methyltransferase